MDSSTAALEARIRSLESTITDLKTQNREQTKDLRARIDSVMEQAGRSLVVMGNGSRRSIDNMLDFRDGFEFEGSILRVNTDRVAGAIPVIVGGTPAEAAAAAVLTGVVFKEVTLASIGAGDWARLHAVLVACAYKYPVRLSDGDWHCDTAQLLPSGTTLIGSPGVRIIQSLALGSGNPLIAAFAASEAAGSFSTTLASNAVIGKDTLALTSVTGLNEGDYIKVIETTYRAVIFRVKSILGTTVTVDRPIRNALLATNAVATVVPCRDIHIQGNGMSISGQGARFLEIINGVDCTFEGVMFDGVDGLPDERVISIDMCCYNVHASKLRASFTRTGVNLHTAFSAGSAINATTGFASPEPCYCVQIARGGAGVATSYTVTGLDKDGAAQTETLTSSGATTIIGSKQWSEITGLTSNVDPTVTSTLQTYCPVTIGGSFESAESCSFTQCEFAGTTTGLVFQDAMACSAIDCNALNGALGATFISSDTPTPTLGAQDCRIRGGSYSGNTTHGIQITHGSRRNVIDGASCIGNLNDGIVLTGTAAMAANVISGCTILNCGSSGVDVAGGSVGTKLIGVEAYGCACGYSVLTPASQTVMLDCSAYECNAAINLSTDLDCTGYSATIPANKGPGITCQGGAAFVGRGINLASPDPSAGGTPVKLISMSNATCSCKIVGGNFVVGSNDWAASCAFAGNTMSLEGVTITEYSGATGTYGIFQLAGTLYIGPNNTDTTDVAWTLVNATRGTAAPTAGTWKVGDICTRVPRASGQPVDWLCTVQGTPGTWVPGPNAP